MTEKRAENIFAKLAVQQAKREPEPAAAAPAAASVPSPAPPPAAKAKRGSKAKVEANTNSGPGKRENDDYCQANGYIPKTLRKAVQHALVDQEEHDFSTLIEHLLRKWLKERGIEA